MREVFEAMPARAAKAKANSKTGGRERTLTQERIIEGALELISREGAEALTMRQLASSLEFSPMAAYYYVDSKDDLLKLVGNAVLSKVVVPPPEAGTWEQRLEELITTQRLALSQYPGLREALSGLDLEQRRRLEDAEYDLLVEAGFSAQTVVPAFRVLLDWAYGNARIESSLRDPSSRRPPEAWTKAQRATFDRAKMPALTADDYFGFGLRTVIDGLRATLQSVRHA
jgi:AcrR family transcriptional regulator